MDDGPHLHITQQKSQSSDPISKKKVCILDKLGDPVLALQLQEANDKIKRLEVLIDRLEVKLHRPEKQLVKVAKEKDVLTEISTQHATKVKLVINETQSKSTQANYQIKYEDFTNQSDVEDKTQFKKMKRIIGTGIKATVKIVICVHFFTSK